MNETVTENIDIKEAVESTLVEIIQQQFWEYAPFIAGILFGVTLTFFYHKFVGRKAIVKSYERLIESKNETIMGYHIIISDRLAKLDQDGQDNGDIIKRLKKYFKRTYK